MTSSPQLRRLRHDAGRDELVAIVETLDHLDEHREPAAHTANSFAIRVGRYDAGVVQGTAGR